MITWPEESLGDISIVERHACFSYFYSRFKSNYIVETCTNCGYGAINKQGDKQTAAHMLECVTHCFIENTPNFLDFPIVEHFRKLENRNQLSLIIKYQKYYFTEYLICYCSMCNDITILHVEMTMMIGHSVMCRHFLCDSIFCASCSSEYLKKGRNMLCFKHDTLFEALYGFIFLQKRINLTI